MSLFFFDEEQDEERGSVAIPQAAHPSIPGYLIEQLLARGSSSSVYSGTACSSARKVALKILHRPSLHSSSGDGYRSFREEVDIMRTLEGHPHPNVLPLIDFVETDQFSCIVTPLCRGCLLDELATSAMEEADARRYFVQLAAALKHVHGLGIVHRDVKVENVFLTEDGVVKLGDWGSAARVSSRHLGRSNVVASGSPLYAAPELFGDHVHDWYAADVWSLGVVLFAMVTGKFPFLREAFDDLSQAVRTGVFDVPVSLSQGCRDLIHLLLQVDTERRPKLSEVLTHPWNGGTVPETVSKTVASTSTEECADESFGGWYFG